MIDEKVKCLFSYTGLKGITFHEENLDAEAEKQEEVKPQQPQIDNKPPAQIQKASQQAERDARSHSPAKDHTRHGDEGLGKRPSQPESMDIKPMKKKSICKSVAVPLAAEQYNAKMSLDKPPSLSSASRFRNK